MNNDESSLIPKAYSKFLEWLNATKPDLLNFHTIHFYPPDDQGIEVVVEDCNDEEILNTNTAEKAIARLDQMIADARSPY
ncbi:MAG: hypothetical protein AAFX78_10125 [Cyanobacteria bacterium J06638_20]